MTSRHNGDLNGSVDGSEGSRVPLRNGAGRGLTTASAPPQHKANYHRPLNTKSAPAPAIAEEPDVQELPANAFFPSNPWKQEEEGKREHSPSSSYIVSHEPLKHAIYADGWSQMACRDQVALLPAKFAAEPLPHAPFLSETCCSHCAGAYKVNPILTRLLGGDAGSRFDGWLLTVSSQVSCSRAPTIRSWTPVPPEAPRQLPLSACSTWLASCTL